MKIVIRSKVTLPCRLWENWTSDTPNRNFSVRKKKMYLRKSKFPWWDSNLYLLWGL